MYRAVLRVTRAVVPFLVLLALTLGASAQDVSGNISGTVQDSSGAVVPNANISVTNVEQGAVLRTTKSDGSGSYSVTQLPIGRYTLTAEAPGFKKSTKTGVELNVSDRLTVSFTMEIGAVTEEVRVEEAPVQVETQTVTASSLITGTQVRELQLNARNFAALTLLSPGVVSNLSDQVYIGTSNPLGGGNTVAISINGARPGANNWTVDGADNVDRGSNQTLLNYPSVDAIAEFKILRGQYSAEFGRTLGGQINVVTKSGGNQFHGSGYEFFRNDAIAANNFFNNANRLNLGSDGKAKVPPLRYNNFGYTVGGPVWVPKVYNGKNKTFFFWSQEFRRVRTYGTAQGVTPTAAQKLGQFTNPVCLAYSADFTTCTQTGTQVSNISPVAQAYLKDVFSQLPNGAPGTNTIFTSLRNVADARQELIRGDHIFGEKLTISGRYLQDKIPTIEPGGLFTGSPLPGVSTTSTNSPGRSVVIRGTSSFSAKAANEAGYGYSYGAIISRVTGSLSSTGSPDIKVNLPFPSTIARPPSIAIANGSSLTGFGPYDDFNRNHQAFDNFTYILGKHTLKVGGTYYHYEKTENAGNGNQGTFTFAGALRPTGSAATVFEQAFANFLTGNTVASNGFTQAQLDLTPKIRANSFEFYGQDDWRVRPNLTVNLGLRYSLFRAPFDANGFLSNFDERTYDPAKAPQVNPTTGNIVAGTGDLFNGQTIVNNAKDVFGHSSPYGTKISNEHYGTAAPRIGIAWDPFGTGKTSVRSGYGLYYDTPLYGIYEQNVFANPSYSNTIIIPNATLDNPAGGTATVNLAPKALRATPSDYKTPYVQQWSFDVQREVQPGLIVDVGYYGSKGTHLIGIRDINQVRPGLAAANGLLPAAGYFVSGTTPPLNALRPYRGYNAINKIETIYNSNYHSLQVGVDKRFARSGQFGIAYTWSKSLGDNRTDRGSAPQNSYNISGEKGLNEIDRRHVFTANYVYEIPFLREQKGFVGQVLGGWELSGIVTMQSGLPLNPASGNGRDYAGLGFLGSSAAGPRPDWACNPNINAPHTFQKWFNTECFVEPTPGANRPGNAGRSIIRGPGFQRWDTALFKNFRLPRESIRVQFRAEAFNVFNHTNPSGVNTTLGSGQYGQVISTRDPRIMQLALKAYF